MFYLDIRTDCCTITNPRGIGQSHIRVGSAQLCPQSRLEPDGEYCDDDHDDHDDETDHHPDGDGQHLVVVPGLLLHFSFSNLLYRLVGGLDQEVDRVAPAVPVLRPHHHLEGRPWLELPHLEHPEAALDPPDDLPARPQHLQAELLAGAGGERLTGDLQHRGYNLEGFMGKLPSFSPEFKTISLFLS